MLQRNTLTGLTACLLALAAPASAQQDGRSLLQRLDQDHDKTLSWDEVRSVVHNGFAALEADHDNTLDSKEAAKAGINQKTLRAADPDHDDPLDEGEYTKLAKQRFDAADRDHDGTLSRAELNSPAGRALTRMLRVQP